MSKKETAMALFKQGYNCSQSVAMAFADEIGMTFDQVRRLTCGFGGGMGRMREVCGAVSGMTFVISAVYDEDKGKIYQRVQALAEKFREENGSIVCRELLGLSIKGADSPIPEKRTESYYKKRPCSELVGMAAELLENYLNSNPI